MFAYICSLKPPRVKRIVHISALKRFDVNKHVPNQKYKLIDGDESQECIVWRFADTKEELEKHINETGNRDRLPSVKTLQSAAESTDDETQMSKRPGKSVKRKADNNNVLAALNKQLAKLDNTENNSNQEKNVFQSEIIEPDKENSICSDCEQFRKQLKSEHERIVQLTDEIDERNKDLSESLDREFILGDKVKKYLEELQTLRELNMEWQKTAIEKHNNVLALHKATVETPRQFQGTGKYPPVGYITEDESEIHLGRGIYLSMQAWALALHVPTTRQATFAKNILVSLCGYDYLTQTTVTGKGSNRNKQSRKPQQQLDPKIVLAIRDIYTYYLITEKKLTEEEAEIQAGKVHTHISKKISSLKEQKQKAYAKKSSKPILGTDENDSEGPTTSGGPDIVRTLNETVADENSGNVELNSSRPTECPVDHVDDEMNSLLANEEYLIAAVSDDDTDAFN
ncbi:uncharacterized protein LOC122498288 [Leptopilina heterotoma]|uniref:uncharacterized protein LOC122498288 n=1 Tax=Leptopilina heterotoma TaxID=63436 RepID=UPI001CA7B985|nr:uncharacterized protein LOC122498288 [Leptopilina heterotoma]